MDRQSRMFKLTITIFWNSATKLHRIWLLSCQQNLVNERVKEKRKKKEKKIKIRCKKKGGRRKKRKR